MNDPTPEMINAKIYEAFSHLYPDYADHTDGIIVVHNEDETIDVQLEGITTFRAAIDSDDDGYLRFGLYDPDYEAEYPDEDRLDFLMIRVKVL